MWDEINKKQNEENMIQLLFYSRNLYNKSTRIGIFKIIVVIINITLSLVQKDTVYLSAVFFLAFTILEICENFCVRNAARARNLFDNILFDFESSNYEEEIKEKAYSLCKRHKKEYEIQKANLGTDNPPGLRNWYSEKKENDKNEIIFKCQIENTKWDKKITKIDLLIFNAVLIIVSVLVGIKYYNRKLCELISVILVGIELVYETIKRFILYLVYNNNISNRECLINQFSKNKIKKGDLVFLQSFIEKRREMDLVPLNFIHKKITNYMHDIINKINK